MEARLVEVVDDQGPGVGLVILTYDVDNERTVISDPILTAVDVDTLRPHVNNLIQAFEHPILTAEQHRDAVESGSLPEDAEVPPLVPPTVLAERDAELQAEAEAAAEGEWEGEGEPDPNIDSDEPPADPEGNE